MDGSAYVSTLRFTKNLLTGMRDALITEHFQHMVVECACEVRKIKLDMCLSGLRKN